MNMTPCKMAETSLLPPASDNSIASCTLKMKVPSKPQFTSAEQHGVMCHKCATQTSTGHLLCGSHVAHKLCTEQLQPCTMCHTPATHISVFIKVLLRDRRRSFPCSDGAAAYYNTRVLSNIKNICLEAVFDSVRRTLTTASCLSHCVGRCRNSLTHPSACGRLAFARRWTAPMRVIAAGR